MSYSLVISDFFCFSILLSCTPDVSCLRDLSHSFSTPYVCQTQCLTLFASHSVCIHPVSTPIQSPPMAESLGLLFSHSLTMYVSLVLYLANLYVPLPIYPLHYIYPRFSHCQTPSACIRSSASTTPGRGDRSGYAMPCAAAKLSRSWRRIITLRARRLAWL